MKFGVRECANIVFRAKQPIRIGTATFQTGQPVLYIDTATTSSIEQATTTVYAQGGRGNARLLAWEGEKTLTFSFTDALLSPIGFAILSGAGLFKRGNGPDDTTDKESNGEDLVHFHMTSGATLTYDSTSGKCEVDLRNAIAEFGPNASICVKEAPIYIMETEEDGSLTGAIYSGTVTDSNGILTITNPKKGVADVTTGASVIVDYYIDLPGQHVYEADITPETFGGNYYVEADTLFRDQHTGKDLPANLTFPNVRLQSNFTMTFAGTGDPSTFDFTMDAFPDYTYFDKKKKVLAVLQVVDSIKLGALSAAAQAEDPVMYHDGQINDASASAHDSSRTTAEAGGTLGVFKWNNGESGSREINIPHVNDAISFGSYVTMEDKAGNPVSLSDYAPTWIAYVGTATSDLTSAYQYISLSDDGYIVAKAETTDPVHVVAQMPSFAPSDTSAGSTALTLDITIGTSAANG